MIQHPLKTASTLLALTAGAFFAGCHTPNAQNPRTALRLQDSASQVAAANARLSQTVASLDKLAYGSPDKLQAQYRQFSNNLDDLQDAASDVRSASLDMQSRGDAYFQQWRQQVASMHSQSIRQASAKQQEDVRQHFDEMTQRYTAANRDLSNVVTLLDDIHTHLSTDLTPAGIQAIRDQVDKVDSQARDVRQSLAAVNDSFHSLGMNLPPQQQVASEDNQD